MPNKFPNTVSEGRPDQWHNASEKFGSRNPDDPEDPGTLDDGVDIGPAENFDDSKSQEIEQNLSKKNRFRHLGESALIAEEKGAAEISQHNERIFDQLVATLKDEISSDINAGESNPRRTEYSNNALDILAETYGTMSTMNYEDIQPINSILEGQLANYRKQVDFFSNQFINREHARDASNKANITEYLLAQTATIESDQPGNHRRNVS